MAGAEHELARALAARRLCVPMREGGLWATTDDRGRTQVVAFTDPAAVEAWAGRPVPYAVMPGAEVCAVAAKAGAGALWIDPGAPDGVRLDRRVVDAVARDVTLRSDAR